MYLVIHKNGLNWSVIIFKLIERASYFWATKDFNLISTLEFVNEISLDPRLLNLMGTNVNSNDDDLAYFFSFLRLTFLENTVKQSTCFELNQFVSGDAKS